MFDNQPDAHHHPPEPPPDPKDLERAIVVVDFFVDASRYIYYCLIIVGLLKTFGMDEIAGAIVSFLGGPADFAAMSVVKAMLCMLPVIFIVNFIRFSLDDDDEDANKGKPK